MAHNIEDVEAFRRQAYNLIEEWACAWSARVYPRRDERYVRQLVRHIQLCYATNLKRNPSLREWVDDIIACSAAEYPVFQARTRIKDKRAEIHGSHSHDKLVMWWVWLRRHNSDEYCALQEYAEAIARAFLGASPYYKSPETIQTLCEGCNYTDRNDMDRIMYTAATSKYTRFFHRCLAFLHMVGYQFYGD